MFSDFAGRKSLVAIVSTSSPRWLPQKSLPPYAYLPGKKPHPVRDPTGHSYHVEPIPIAAEEACVRPRALLAAGFPGRHAGDGSRRAARGLPQALTVVFTGPIARIAARFAA